MISVMLAPYNFSVSPINTFEYHIDYLLPSSPPLFYLLKIFTPLNRNEEDVHTRSHGTGGIFKSLNDAEHMEPVSGEHDAVDLMDICPISDILYVCFKLVTIPSYMCGKSSSSTTSTHRS